RSAIRAGLFLSHVPGVPKLDFRVEGVYTDPSISKHLGPGFFYFNDRFLNGYTNDGQLMASWIGREGQGAQAWTNYWFTPRDRIQLNFRHQKVSAKFIPGGGTVTDFGARSDYDITKSVGLSVSVQYERWLFPVLRPGPTTNVSSFVEFDFHPSSIFQRASDRATARQFAGSDSR